MEEVKQYKLKKWYPGLPKEWKLYAEDIIATKRGNNYMAELCGIPLDEVENNPEYWKYITNLQVPIGTDFIVKEGNSEIIYTIRNTELIEHGNKLVVVSWDNNESSVRYTVENVNENFENGSWIKKEDIYLFTTSDGIDIHIGDEYWIVFHNNFNIQKEEKAIGGGGKRKDATYFSTKERAQEWINNQPQYSYNDIKKMMEEVEQARNNKK